MAAIERVDIRELQTLYINLDRHPDRREYMEKLLKDNGFKSFSRQPAILVAPNMIEGWQGCAFSHCCAAKRLYKTCKDKWCLVLEDDIRFTDIDIINRAINEIINKYPDIDCITITNHPTEREGQGIYCPILPRTRGTHFMFYRKDSLLKIANGLFNKWLQGMACDLWEFDQLIGIKSAAFYSDSCEQLKQSFVSQNEHHSHMNIIIEKDPLEGKDFTEICFRNDRNARFRDTSIYRVYHIDGTNVTELFGDNTVKVIRLPERLNALIESTDITEQYKSLIIYNHSLMPQFNVFRLWNHDRNDWDISTVQ